jgi:hypothetical protein
MTQQQTEQTLEQAIAAMIAEIEATADMHRDSVQTASDPETTADMQSLGDGNYRRIAQYTE